MRASRLFASAVIAASMVFGSGTPARAATLDAAEADLLAQVNALRSSIGLPTLVLSDTLTSAATWMSADMAAGDYFAHTSLDGRSPQQRMTDAGYPAYATWTGEDLAAGYAGAAGVLAAWVASPTHYAVLTNPAYRAIGIADGTASSVAVDTGYHSAWVGQSATPTLAPGEVATLVSASPSSRGGSARARCGRPRRRARTASMSAA